MPGRSRARKAPKILEERRRGSNAPTYRDKIWTRDWSKNPLGQAFVEKPESMKQSRFYSEVGGLGSPEEYRQHKQLEGIILNMLKARPVGEHGIQFYRGKSGAYYIVLRGTSSNESIYIRVNKSAKIRNAIAFLFK